MYIVLHIIHLNFEIMDDVKIFWSVSVEKGRETIYFETLTEVEDLYLRLCAAFHYSPLTFGFDKLRDRTSDCEAFRFSVGGLTYTVQREQFG